MVDRNLVPKDQRKLIDIVEAVNLAYTMNNDEEPMSAVFHSQAVDGAPGYNIFLKNMRFELGYQRSKLKFSIPYDNDELDRFKNFLEHELKINEYDVFPSSGIKYVLEVGLENYIYSDEGIETISKLANKVLEYL